MNDDKLREAFMAGGQHVADMLNGMFSDFGDTQLSDIVVEELDDKKVNEVFEQWKQQQETEATT